MSKGKAIVEKMGIQGQVGYESAPQWDFLYSTSTVKDEKYDVGDKVELPDGREFRYALSGAACVGGYACNFGASGAYTGYVAAGIASVVGDNFVTVAATSHAVLTKDELKNGYVILFQGSSDLNTTVRGIIGNDAAADGAAYKIYLDAAVTFAYVAGTAATEVYKSPWANVGYATGYAPAGVPAAYVSAASVYLWVQTKGITWAGPESTVGADGASGVFWASNGSLVSPNVSQGITIVSGNTSTYAGSVVVGSAAGDGPLLDLRN